MSHDPKRKECPRHGWIFIARYNVYVDPDGTGRITQYPPDCTCKPDKPDVDEIRAAWKHWPDHMRCPIATSGNDIYTLLDHIDALKRELEAAKEPIKDTYSCGDCGRKDGLDCVLPNHIWNQLQEETGHSVLCTWCIDRECAARGIDVRVLLAFCGTAVYGGSCPENNDPHWEKHLGDLTARCSNAETENTALKARVKELESRSTDT